MGLFEKEFSTIEVILYMFLAFFYTEENIGFWGLIFISLLIRFIHAIVYVFLQR